jgi:hypothetical protein
MDTNTVGSVGVVLAALLIAAVVLLVMLAIAPLKLYGIHREIRRTNDLLIVQNELISKLIAEQGRAGAGLVAAIAWDKKSGGTSG